MSSIRKFDKIDSNVKFSDATDSTKELQFDLSSITPGTTKVFTIPDGDSNIVGHDLAQTLTNKTIDADNNTITNIDNLDIKAGAAIDATKIHDGTVSNTEFGYLNGVTSALQTQLDSKSSTSHTHVASDITSGTFADARISQSSVTQHESVLNIQNLLNAPTSTVVGNNDVQTLTNKTIDSNLNSISNISDGNIQAGAAIDASKIHDGSVSNTEFGYLNGVTSAIQTQLDGKASSGHSHSSAGGWTDDGGTVRLTTSTDNVGIGISNPSKFFEVRRVNPGQSNHVQLVINDSNITDEYNLGLDTSDNCHVVVSCEDGAYRQATVIASDGVGEDKTIFGIAGSMNSGSSWNPLFTVTQAGCVGIGKSAASECLDVVGNIAVSGLVDTRNVSADGAILDSHIIDASAHGVSGIIVGTTDSQTLTNKTIDADNNTITNIDNSNIKSGAAIDATKIHNGTVSNTEFGYLNGVTSAIQTQLDSKASASHTHAASDIISGTFADARISQSSVTQHESALNINNLLNAPSSTVVGNDDVQTLTNKTIDGSLNSVSNISDGNIQVGAAIDAAKIHNGSVSNAEFGYLNGVTSAIQTQLDGKASSSHSHTSSDITDFDSSVDSRISIQKGAVNGLASLNGSGKIPATQLDLDSVDYQGTWNANTNTPSITNGTGTKGHYYVVSVAGTTTIDGINDWQTGDWIIFNGTVWEKSDHTDQVTSVAGKQGAVTLEASDIISGTFSDARISQSSVLQHESALNIQNLTGAPSGSVVGNSDTQTLTNKTIDADNNTITNIDNSDIKTGAAIDASKIHDGSISNTEFGYLNGVTSSIQTQLDGKASTSHTHAASDVTSGTFADARISQSSVTQHSTALESILNHDNLSGYVENEHIDHTTVSINAGIGLSGGGNISATRTIDLDINSLSADVSPDGAADYVVTYDASAGGHKKVLINNLPTTGGGETNTASNVGSGADIFKQKTGVDLELRGINAASSKITATVNADNIDIDVVPSQIAIGDLNGAPTGSVVGNSDTQTLTNKSIDADNNNITNIDNSDIKIGAAIDAAKIHDGTVSNTEFGYLNGVTSAIQTQLDGKASSTHSHSSAGGWTDDGGTVRLTTSTDNVGIGISNPSKFLEVRRVNPGQSNHVQLVVSDSTIVDDYNLGLDTSDSCQITMSCEDAMYRQATVFCSDGFGSSTIFGIAESSDNGSNWNPVFVVKQDDKVGIGKNNPSEALDIVGSIALTGTVDGRDIAVDGAKLDGISSGATANDTDANLKNRANHTGTQLASTISDFDSAVSSSSHASDSDIHIDHTLVHILSGDGITTGDGNISANVTVGLDINTLTADASPDGAADYVVTYDASASGHKKVLLNNLPGGGGGETNTASNVGAGADIFKQKTGVDLEFRGINAASSKITSSVNGDNIDIDIVPGEIDIGDLNGAPTGSVVGNSDTQTLTNKTINADNNTITNIDNSDIKVGAAIDAAKIHDGTVSNTEFGYLNGVTSGIQTQLDGKISNVGTAIGDILVYDGASFSKLARGNIGEFLTVDTGQDIDIKWGVINHNSLSGFVANEHIDHSTVSITAGVGLSGGGTIAATRTLDLDIASLTADATPDGAADYVVTYDASATTHKKVLLNNLPGGGGGSLPTTTKGDLVVHNGSTNIRLPIGTNGYCLQADSAETSGVKWAQVGDTVALVQARKTTAHSISEAWSTITFDTTDIETDSTVIEHNNTNTDRIDIKQTGNYELYYNVNAVADSGTFHDIYTKILLNGATLLAGSESSGAGYGTGGTGSDIISSSTKRICANLTSGDYVTLQIQYNTTSITGSTRFDPIFSVKRLEGTVAGATGAPGADGDITWQGAWVSQNYTTNQAVSYNGSSYVCHTNTVSNEIPTNTSYWDILASKGDTGAGETNTISNVGTGGVGIWKQKVGVDHQLKKINSTSSTSGITIVDDTGNDEIDIRLSINSLTADATPDGASDYILTYDTSATAHKKVLLNDLPGGSTTYHEVSATTTVATSSASYILIPGMTYTPASGTYHVSFSSSAMPDGHNAIAYVAIYSGGSIIQHSERQQQAGGAQGKNDQTVHTQAVCTVNGSQAIEARYRIDSSSYNLYERSMFLWKIA